jgi:hypothetical protein
MAATAPAPPAISWFKLEHGSSACLDLDFRSVEGLFPVVNTELKLSDNIPSPATDFSDFCANPEIERELEASEATLHHNTITLMKNQAFGRFIQKQFNRTKLYRAISSALK